MGDDKQRKRSASPADGANIYHKGFKEFLSTFKDNDQYSDLTIQGNGKEWHVHRVILSPQSDWFKTACGNGFLESKTQSIDLTKEDVVVLEMMISFFYSLNYDDEAGCTTPITTHEPPVSKDKDSEDDDPLDSSSDDSDEDHPQAKLVRTPLLNSALVYSMGEKYQAKWLKERAIAKTWYRLTEDFHLREYSQAIATVWSSTPYSDKRLRNLYLEQFLIRRAEMVRGSKADTKAIWAHNRFLHDVLRAEAKLLEGSTESDLALSKVWTCKDCNRANRSRWCDPTMAQGLAFTASRSEPSTAMFSERTSRKKT